MSNDPSWDSIFPTGGDVPASEPASPPARTRRELREQEAASTTAPHRNTFAEVSGGGKPPRKRPRLRWLWVLLVIIVLGGVTAGAVYELFPDQVKALLGHGTPSDYTGTGNGTEADVVVPKGATGLTVAKALAAAQVTATSKAPYDILLAHPEITFQPGTYKLQQHMSAQAAIDALQDSKNRVESKVVIPEGTTITKLLTITAKATGIPLADLQKVAKNYTSLGIPKAAPNAEGWLFPATYSFDPGATAQQVLQAMADRMTKALVDAGVAQADRLKVLTLAGLVQKEGGKASDFPKIARVFDNRIAQGMLLQSDATVAYGAGLTSLFTTAAQRADASNKYNTYVHAGLPIGPISAPGDAAIDAALHPAKGTWIYFVLVNGDTGETAFSTTLAQHEAAVKQFQAWLKAHPDYDTGG